MTVGAIRSLSLLAFLTLFSGSAIAQDATAGKNFWVAFPQNARFEIGALKQWIVVTALEDAEVAVTRPAWKPSSVFSLGRKLKNGETYTFDLDTSVQCITSEAIEAKGIHIGSTGEITVTAYSIRKASTDSYRVMPITTLGREYMVVGYDAPTADPTFMTEFTIVATEDNTQVDVTLSGTTKGGRLAQELIPIKLNRGDTYNVKGGYTREATGDLTGSTVQANKPVAVFTGHTCAQVPSNYNFCDVLIEQSAPLSRAGHEFVLPAMKDKVAFAFRVVATEQATTVRFGESTSILNAGEHDDYLHVEGDRVVVADKPVIIAQYGTSFDADVNKIGDPFMTLVPPIERFTNLNTVTIPRIGPDWHHYVAIACETSALESLEINSSPADIRKTSRVTDQYSVVHLELGQGVHQVSANGKLAVFSYGFGVGNENFDSYGTYCGPW